MKENRFLKEERFVVSARGVAKAHAVVGGETSFAVGGYCEHHVCVENGVENFVPYADSPRQVSEEVAWVVAPPESEVAAGESEWNVAPHIVDALNVDEVVMSSEVFPYHIPGFAGTAMQNPRPLGCATRHPRHAQPRPLDMRNPGVGDIFAPFAAKNKSN